ncbi:AraC family transcriptional regulator ligand-binding domain-containing protein [Nocardia sp. NPDC050712]|uniref:AraC family transcriptional regulator n=1 Tax=Nocardia sp. NPDC050712 TaxID=3155518 RepID=UPI0033ED2C82
MGRRHGASGLATDQTLLHRFVIAQLAAAGLDRDRLIRECGVPAWALTGPGVYMPSETFGRLWEVAGRWLDDPAVALRIGARYEFKATGLFDYLFSSAPTVGAGLATCGPYVSAVTTNHRFDLVDAAGGGAKLSLEMLDGEGRARDHTQVWGLTAVLTRARRLVDAPLDPVRVSLRQRAPRNLDAFREVFPGARIDFGAAEDALTFRATDMDIPLRTADPVLASVLQPLAAVLPPPPPAASAWPERVAVAIGEELAAGEVSLQAVARRLITSPRTLQRRLAESGTTWRRELDRARCARLTLATDAGPLSRADQARLLGYSDSTGWRRTALRWAVATDAAFAPGLPSELQMAGGDVPEGAAFELAEVPALHDCV